jgi:hypothetical protein
MSDLRTVLGWAATDAGFVERIGANLDEDRRAVLKAVVETRGDMKALAQRLAPAVVQKARARAPERVAKALDLLGKPLGEAWSAPGEVSAQHIAERFLEKYGARLEELTGSVSKASAAAKGAAGALQTVASSKELLGALSSLDEQVAELTAAASACAHPEGAGDWASRGTELAREGKEAADAARALRTTATNLKARCETVHRALQAWVDAPPATRAATAQSLGSHLRAASLVVGDMREQIARLAL